MVRYNHLDHNMLPTHICHRPCKATLFLLFQSKSYPWMVLLTPFANMEWKKSVVGR